MIVVEIYAHPDGTLHEVAIDAPIGTTFPIYPHCLRIIVFDAVLNVVAYHTFNKEKWYNDWINKDIGAHSQ
jgi:hypothetical protein